MGDLETLRAVQAAVGVCVFVLIFVGTYRPTRSSFAAWWGAVVGASALSTGVIVVLGDAVPRLGAILGNGVSVMGAAFAWVAARSLRGLSTRWPLYAVPALASAVATWVENPEGTAWPGGLSLLVGMAVMLGLSARELIALCRTHSRAPQLREYGEAQTAMVVLAVSSVVASGFYVVRTASFVILGPEDALYVNWLGPGATTFLILILLVVVSYTVTALSHYQVEGSWRERALRDDLTGMMSRGAFIERAQGALARGDRVEPVGALIVADIDHFKDVNDLHGHPYGDRVLVAFARATQATLGDDDFAGRFGGEEFVIFLAEGSVHTALSVTDAINAAFESTAEPSRTLPTVSYGVAPISAGVSLTEVIEMADRALYRAKRAGRARTAVHEDDHG